MTSTPLNADISSVPADGGWQKLERALVWLGDRLNPILVKETRQALKSRQFVITFTLVLVLAWIWSILGVSLIGPSIFYAARGFDMFLGYYVILAVPMLVVVPFGAFRSLASEREDGTFEMLSITTLRPRQIVSGKLGSAVLQMLVYLSAVVPCLAFTYMLRGIDAPTIVYVICCFCLASLGASVIGLFVATLTHDKHWQIVLSVLYLFGLASLLWIALMLAFALLAEVGPPAFQDRVFWIVNAMMLTAYASYFALFYCAAGAQLAFASDNRSTALRRVMVVQQALLIGWFGWAFLQEETRADEILAYFILAGIHWAAMGMLINGELGEMSLRVKRQLPQSFFGRVFFTWFNPGPATGFMFIVANLVAAIVVGAAILAGDYVFRGRLAGTRVISTPRSVMVAFAALELCYIVFYLGLARLVISLLRRVTPVSLTLAVLLQVLLVMAGSGIPVSIHLMTPSIRNGYSLIEITNPFFSLTEVIEAGDFDADVMVLLIVVPVAAVLVFLANVPAIVTAVHQVRIAKPQRVAEEAPSRKRSALRRRPGSPFEE